MRKVDRCVQRPLHCAVFPTLGAGHAKGYYDVNVNLPGPGIYENRVYVSVEAVEALARKEGWLEPAEQARLNNEVEGLARQLEQCRAELTEARRQLEAIDVIESADFRARKRAGRPKAKVAG